MASKPPKYWSDATYFYDRDLQQAAYLHYIDENSSADPPTRLFDGRYYFVFTKPGVQSERIRLLEEHRAEINAADFFDAWYAMKELLPK